MKIFLPTFIKPCGAVLLALAWSAGQAQASDGKVLYQSQFTNAHAGPPPAEFMVLEGDYAIKDLVTNKVLELPGAPAESFYGILFGPVTNSGVSVSAKVFATGARRRFPTFGVGLDGGSGYCLRVSPAKQAIEIFKGDEPLTNAPFAWKSGEWTQLRLQAVVASDGSFKVEGKAWTQGAAEPKDWMVIYSTTTTPDAGRESVWGTPQSGTPIWFDDLRVTQISPWESVKP